MSVCETEHWVLDCGAGSGCALWEGGDGQVLFWKCYPQVASASKEISMRRKSSGEKRLALDPSEKFTLCYNDLDQSTIAETFREVTGRSIVLSKAADASRKSMCQTGTLEELLMTNGLTLED
jgi:hypothetical protein